MNASTNVSAFQAQNKIVAKNKIIAKNEIIDRNPTSVGFLLAKMICPQKVRLYSNFIQGLSSVFHRA
ncbi:hypothetical protein EIG77_09900 [Avibacterium paragallinarum]|nr:hypothetical protein EIG77_09900 [Avibacterium paragallinarum]